MPQFRLEDNKKRSRSSQITNRAKVRVWWLCLWLKPQLFFKPSALSPPVCQSLDDQVASGNPCRCSISLSFRYDELLGLKLSCSCTQVHGTEYRTRIKEASLNHRQFHRGIFNLLGLLRLVTVRQVSYVTSHIRLCLCKWTWCYPAITVGHISFLP